MCVHSCSRLSDDDTDVDSGPGPREGPRTLATARLLARRLPQAWSSGVCKLKPVALTKMTAGRGALLQGLAGSPSLKYSAQAPHQTTKAKRTRSCGDQA